MHRAKESRRFLGNSSISRAHHFTRLNHYPHMVLPSRKLTYPTLWKKNHLQKCFGRYVSSQEGISLIWNQTFRNKRKNPHMLKIFTFFSCFPSPIELVYQTHVSEGLTHTSASGQVPGLNTESWNHKAEKKYHLECKTSFFQVPCSVN